MTTKDLQKMGKPAVLDNPYKGEEDKGKPAVEVKCVRAEGFFGPQGFVAQGGTAVVSHSHAKELVETGYASVVADPATPESAKPAPGHPAAPQVPAVTG